MVGTVDILPKKKLIDNLISYLRDEANQDLYVVNKSDQNGRKKRTELVFNVRDASGSHSIVVPDTFLPINIGIKVDALSSFARSESFMRLVNLKYMEAIDPDYAIAYMSTEEAVSEQRRLFDTDDDSAGFSITDDSVAAVAAKSAREKGRSSANPKVVNIMLNTTMDDDKRFAALRNITSEIGPTEIDFIMQNTQSERLKTFARNLTA